MSKVSKKSTPSENLPVFSSVEYIDFDKLRKILLSTQSAVKQALDDSPKMDVDKVIKQLHDIYKHVNPTNGKLKVDYAYSENIQEHGHTGRIYAMGPSLQGLPKIFRNSIIQSGSIDVDMVNSHPSILFGEIKKFNDTHDTAIYESEVLREIVEDRDSALDSIASTFPNGDRSVAKMNIIRVLNGGAKKFSEGSDMLAQLVTDAQQIAKDFKNNKITAKYAEMVEQDESEETVARPEFRMLNAFLREKENEILMFVIKLLEKQRITTFCPMFDGIYQLGQFDHTIFNTVIYPKMEKRFGYRVEFIDKPIEVVLDMDRLKYDTVDDSLCMSVFTTQDVEITDNDRYCLSQMQTETTKRIFPNLQTLEAWGTYNFKRICARIMGSRSGYYVKYFVGKSMTFGYNSNLLTSDANIMKIRYFDEKNNIRSVGLEHIIGLVGSYADADYYPPHMVKDMPSLTFNLYRPILAKFDSSKHIDSDKLLYIKRVIREAWAGGDDKLYMWIISWLRELVCNNGKMSRVALYLYSKQGAGKNFIINFLRDFVLGRSHVAEFSGINGLLKEHQTKHVGKSLLFINEMATTSNEFLSCWDKMKAFVTEEYVEINHKHGAIIDYRNFANIIMATNNFGALHIADKNDRRYVCCHVNEKFCGKQNKQFWIDAVKTSYNHEAGETFANWLMSIDPKTLPDPTSVISTRLREELIEYSQSASLTYMISRIEENKNSENPVVSSLLSKEYLTFCNWYSFQTHNSNKTPTSKKFISDLRVAFGDDIVYKERAGQSFNFELATRKQVENSEEEDINYLFVVPE